MVPTSREGTSTPDAGAGCVPRRCGGVKVHLERRPSPSFGPPSNRCRLRWATALDERRCGGIGYALATAQRRASRRRRGELRRTPRHLLRSDVLDVSREIPFVSEDIPDASHAIAVELRRRLAQRCCTVTNCPLIQRVGVLDVEVQHGRHGVTGGWSICEHDDRVTHPDFCVSETPLWTGEAHQLRAPKDINHELNELRRSVDHQVRGNCVIFVRLEFDRHRTTLRKRSVWKTAVSYSPGIGTEL